MAAYKIYSKIITQHLK